jgi:hypothetical protein
MRCRGALHHAALPAVLILLLQSCLVLGAALEGRAAPLSKPISVQPSEHWEGIDGSWNSIPLRVGDPEQYTRVFVSTASQQTWVVHEIACHENVTDTENGNRTIQVVNPTCNDSRGHIFNPEKSYIWDEIGYYELWLEKHLGLWGNGQYGYEKVGLGYTENDGPTLPNTTVGALVTENFWLGHFGINPKSTNFSSFNDPSPSFLTLLFEAEKIPSVSWGYTAGAEYRKSQSKDMPCKANLSQAWERSWEA